MKVELRKLSDIKPYPGNPRHNDDAVDAVAASIREFGFRQPIVVDSEGVIIVGHTRYKAALKLGLETVPVHVAADLTPEQIKAYRIADNQTATLATWNYDLLQVELNELKEANYDLDLLGFDQNELAKLLENIEPEETHELPGRNLQSLWQVVVECVDENAQRELYEKLTAEGYRCRLLIL
jgi:ParB-like chromosome segregation protein Spo0J